MKITSYLSDETIRKISDLIAQEIDNAIWLGSVSYTHLTLPTKA